MVKLYNNFNINKNHKQSIILIGNFDGVHLGHQKLFKLAQSYKKKYNLKIGVINFDPMPKMFFNKSLKNFRLSSINQKLNLLNNLGVDFIVTKKFDKKLIELIKFYKDKTSPIMPVGANVLMTKYKIPEGKQLGLKLKKIEEEWVKNDFKISDEQIEKIVNN